MTAKYRPKEIDMPTYVKDVAAGELPLTVAFAEEVKPEAVMGTATSYSTYTTMSGQSTQSLDDGAVKDEDQ
jgi:hypothetical protein